MELKKALSKLDPALAARMEDPSPKALPFELPEPPFVVGEVVDAETTYGAWGPGTIDHVSHLEGDLWTIGVQHAAGGHTSLAWPDKRIRKALPMPDVASLDTPGVDGWCGWVVRSTPKGWEWARVAVSSELLPFLVVGKVQPGDMRGQVAAFIERDVLSDRLTDPTRWKP